jgi:hypothetical protein
MYEPGHRTDIPFLRSREVGPGVAVVGYHSNSMCNQAHVLQGKWP